MPVINCYVSEETLRTLRREAGERGLTPEFLAEAAIESAALACARERDAFERAWAKARRERDQPLVRRGGR